MRRAAEEYEKVMVTMDGKWVEEVTGLGRKLGWLCIIG